MTDAAVEPVKVPIDGENFLRSEILGRRYIYEIMEELYYGRTKIENLSQNLHKRFEKAEDWRSIIDNSVLLLRKIGASYEMGDLTDVGKTWFTLLEELNMLFPINPLEILTKDIPGHFFRNCFLPLAESVDRLVIISPWISPLNGRKWLFKQTCKKIKENNLRTLVVTRPPAEVWHKEAMDELLQSGADVYVNEDVHAKVLICKVSDRRKSVAIVGSANLTKSGRFDNEEVGVLIKGMTDRYLSLIEDLISSSYDLKKIKWTSK